MRECDPSVAKAIFEKTSDKWKVVADRRARQRAHFDQVLPKCLCMVLNRGQSDCCLPFVRNRAFEAQKNNEIA